MGWGAIGVECVLSIRRPYMLIYLPKIHSQLLPWQLSWSNLAFVIGSDWFPSLACGFYVFVLVSAWLNRYHQDPNWIFSIDGHNLTIIEVDGVNHKPLTVDNIRIFGKLEKDASSHRILKTYH
jgi:hypothetical protein